MRTCHSALWRAIRLSMASTDSSLASLQAQRSACAGASPLPLVLYEPVVTWVARAPSSAWWSPSRPDLPALPEIGSRKVCLKAQAREDGARADNLIDIQSFGVRAVLGDSVQSGESRRAYAADVGSKGPEVSYSSPPVLGLLSLTESCHAHWNSGRRC